MYAHFACLLALWAPCCAIFLSRSIAALAVLFVLAVTLAWRALLVRRPLSARAPWVRLTGPVCLHAGE